MIFPLGCVIFNFRFLIFPHFIVALNDASNLELLKNHIKDIFPQFEQFPWSGATIPTMRQNFEAVMQARKFGLTLDLFSNYISSDHESPRRNLIAFSASGQERTLYFNSTDARYIAYRTYLTDMYQLFTEKVKPGSLQPGEAAQFAQNVIDFETPLAYVHQTLLQELHFLCTILNSQFSILNSQFSILKIEKWKKRSNHVLLSLFAMISVRYNIKK